MNRKVSSTLACAALLASAHSASAIFLTFDDPVVLGSSQAPGTWYTDRYAPAGFEIAQFDGDSRLKHSISEDDGRSGRAGFDTIFYDTQGRKFDTPGATSMSIDLYIPADWETSGRRMAGFWGTGFNVDGDVSLYPIIEFTSQDNDPRFRIWPEDPLTGGWFDLGLPTGFIYDEWYTLGIELGNSVTLSVGDLSHTFPNSNGTTELGNVILQGYNTDTGVSYDIYWDNFAASTVAPIPEPVTGMLTLIGLGGLGVAGLRRRR